MVHLQWQRVKNKVHGLTNTRTSDQCYVFADVAKTDAFYPHEPMPDSELDKLFICDEDTDECIEYDSDAAVDHTAHPATALTS